SAYRHDPDVEGENGEDANRRRHSHTARPPIMSVGSGLEPSRLVRYRIAVIIRGKMLEDSRMPAHYRTERSAERGVVEGIRPGCTRSASRTHPARASRAQLPRQADHATRGRAAVRKEEKAGSGAWITKTKTAIFAAAEVAGMYEQFFGLEDEPFRLTPDPRYLFLSGKPAEALAHLRLGLTESSGFVCITGEVGTGKTTLLRVFLAELGPDVAAAYALTPPLSALDLLRRICREFGVSAPGESHTDLVDALHRYLVAQSAAGRSCVVVLDEAQGLSIELLEQIRLLLNLETATRKLLRIILVGQPQLRKLLLDPELAQLNQRITLRWHLGRLSSRETAAYVHHRLAIASGGRATRLFTRPALSLLHSVSGGTPRLINMVAH